MPTVLDLQVRGLPAMATNITSELLRVVCEAALVAEGVAARCAATISFVDDQEIARLNARHRGIDAPTDVLSFPLDAPYTAPRAIADGVPIAPFVTPDGYLRDLGDVVVSYPRAVAQAGEYGHSVEREVAFLVVHGLLHILGYDHEAEDDRLVMRSREEAALATVGLVRA